MSFPFRLPIAIVVMAIGAAGCGQQGKLKPAVELQRLFDRTEQDLGAIRIGARYSATYRLMNSTAGSLIVSDIKTSCGCMAANYDGSAVAPGAFRDITLALSTNDQTVLGPMVKHAWVRFSTGERIELLLKARLEPEFEINPRELKFLPGVSERLSVIRKQIEPEPFRRLVLVAPEQFYEVVENASASTPDRREFSVGLKAVPAGANLPDLSISDSQSGRPLPFSVVHCSRQGPTLRPSACVFVVTGEQLPPSQRFEIVEPTAAPIRILKVAAVGKTAQNHLAIHHLDAQSFEVGLTMIPRNPLSNLQIEVEYERDGGASDRLILACHIVVAPKA